MTLRNGYSVNAIADLKAIPPDQRSSTSAYRVVSKNAWYGFVPTSSDADDGHETIAPNVGTGRWKMTQSANSSNSSSGNGGNSGNSSDLSDLTDRVDTLESNVYSLQDEASDHFSRIVALQYQQDNTTTPILNGYGTRITALERVEANRTQPALSRLLQRFKRVVNITPTYDSATNQSICYVPGFANSINSFILVVEAIDANGTPQPFTVQYLITSQVPTAAQVANVYRYAKLTLAGNISTQISVFVDRYFANASTADSFVNELYSGL